MNEDKKRLKEWYIKKYTQKFLFFKWVKKVDLFTVFDDLQKEINKAEKANAPESELIKLRGMQISII
jgi:hypothetical protein